MQEELQLPYDEMLDRVEAQMHEIGVTEFETTGFFCGGIYVRTVFVPAGSYLTSMIHKVEHPYVLSEGQLTMFTQDGEQVVKSPHINITLAGTRRFARADTDVLFTTFHRTDKTMEADVELEVVEKRINPLLTRKDGILLVG